MAGYGIVNSLSGGRSIGVSAELADVKKRWDAAAGVRVIEMATVVGIGLVERPVYPQLRCWLEGDVPHDAQAKMLHGHFSARLRRKAEPLVVPEIPEAMREAMQRDPGQANFDALTLAKRIC